MKYSLRFSALANVILAAVVVYFAHSHWPAKKTAAGGRLIPEPPTAQAGLKFDSSTISVPSKSEPFTWSQIESPDYHTYITNLRSVGCPEPTIRDIIVADVHGLYAPLYQQLEQIVALLGGAGRSVRQAHEKEIQRVHREEAEVISALLGGEPDRDDSAQPVAQSRGGRSRNSRSASLPLAFREAGPIAINLNERQLAVIDELRQEFLEEIGSATSETDGLDYCKRWQIAQRNSDDLLQGFLGGQFFVEYQQQTANDRE